MKRKLGNSEAAISPLGLGCWAIGGPFTLGGLEDGWGAVDDNESIAAIHAALEAGVNFFDTADAYGAGHSETILGQALKGRRGDVVIATKFGYTNNPAAREVYLRHDVTPEYIRKACENSLRRLGTDYIDLYQIHVGMLIEEETESAIGALNRLREEGLIRSYGWSTWDVGRAAAIAEQPGAVAIQHALNVLQDAPDLIELCEARGLTSINNSPLAMGLLSGKFNGASRLAPTDVRGSGHEWVAYFKDGKPVPAYLDMLESVREILTSGGRSLVQGALAWIWGRSESAVPIPGFKTRKQAEELASAVEHGPLLRAQMDEIRSLLASFR
ncbi:aldo/keto reductase [Paenibacillus methanolicus]|uniref:Aryl-alcohol dehydrogenase-like predicted oxidoreductase n=1 Tax=Paenibacillus methanolicus TaxID=582686 RepID=A0A5S5CHP5_9BACL|nr:aldo/keto reductase [Paenibacillus methanolicus]TYP79054.1 aryl-alcohol dehydrogenase-like predicted oxidoreductase [Paenibacillus methanolicus]